jgi:two-component system cell cycle sensor histidine kinase/response regulator CckA
MSEEVSRSEAADDLRQRAEDKAGETGTRIPESLEALSTEEAQDVLHNLRVHQIELEMQNEELRRAQEELEDARARYFDLFELAPVGYLSVSDQGLVLEANLTFSVMVGVTRARGPLLQRPLSRFVAAADWSIYYLHHRQLLESGEPQACELRMSPADGNQFWARLEMTAVRDAGGTTVCRVAVSDITDRKQLESENSRLQEQNIQVQKMEAVGRLAGGVAHDLNNLLTPILGYGDLLLGDLEPGDAHRESAEQIVRAAERARDIVGRLLAFSRNQVGDFKLIDLSHTAEGLAGLLRHSIRADIAVEFTSGPASCILGDRGQLEQALMNMAVNAQDAMPEGGVLTIGTSAIDVDAARASAVEGLAPGRYAVLSVGDTGHGMDAETQKHIFEPFFTTKEPGSGTGLGLATVYGIAKQHGGTVSVYSEPGQGTTFKIYFPNVDGQVAGAVTGQASSAGSLGKGLRGAESILLVDDNMQVRELTKAILERLGYTVFLAETGRAALKVLESHGAEVRLILTDVVMPGMNGRELVAKVSETYPHIRAVLMSGYAEHSRAHDGASEESVGFVQKPFTVEALATTVRTVLDA